MKKIKTGMLAIMVLWLFAVPCFGYTVYFAVDDTLPLSNIAAIEVYTNRDLGDWTVATQVSGWDVGIPSLPGLDDVHNPPLGWYSADASRLFNPGASPLSSGVVLSINTTTDVSFSISGTFLWVFESDGSAGGYTGNLFINPSFNDANEPVYTASAVPIPAAAWLLGSGVVGLIALKRRKKNG